jgi:urease alpha subunit
LPVAIGIIAASDSSAMIALSERIERRLRQCREGARQQQREQQDQGDHQDDEAVDRDIARRCVPKVTVSASSLRLVGLEGGGFD